MKNTKIEILTKKILSIVILTNIIGIYIPLINYVVRADSEYTNGDFKYIVEDYNFSAYARITKYIGTAENVEIPSSIGNLTVKSMLNTTFESCETVKSVTIPYSIDTISIVSGSIADPFAHENLVSINVDSRNNHFTSVDGVLFDKNTNKLIRYPKGKENTTYTVPTTVNNIEVAAFRDCNNLEEVNILRVMDKINTGAFYNCLNLKTVNAPYVSKIEGHAFSGCENLTNISMNSVTEVGFCSFAACKKLTSIQAFSKLKCIYERAFSFCNSLQNVTLSKELISIGNLAFLRCENLKTIKINENVTSIGKETFKDCPSLEQINVNSNNSIYSSENGILYNKDKTRIVKYPEGIKDTTYKILDSVESTELYAFNKCNNLTKIIISDSFKFNSSWDYMFKNCINISDIEASSENQNYCSEDGILFNKDKTTIVKYASARKAENYEIPENIITIGAYAFSNCNNLTNIKIPTSVTKILGSAFENCNNLKKLEIPDSVNNINQMAFYSCDDITLYVSENSVAHKFAIDNNIKFVITKDGIPLEIYTVVFKDYDGTILKEEQVLEGKGATAPESPKREKYVFEKWDKDFSVVNSNLEIYAVYVDAPDISNISKCTVSLKNTTLYFNGKERKPDVIVIYDGKTLKQNIDYTVTYENNIEVGTAKVTVEGIRDYKGLVQKKFKISVDPNQQCGDNLGWILIGDTLKLSGTGPMYNYSESNNAPWTNLYYTINNYKQEIQITNIQIPDGVTTIGNYAFYGPNGIVTVELPNTIKSIGDNAFSRCEVLEKIEIPDSIENIGKDAFSFCTKLKEIKLSKNVKELNGVFKNCLGLTQIVIPEGITTLYNTFENCGNLTKVELNNGIKEIGENTFAQCLNLTYVKIPSSIDTIKATAFKDCDDVTLHIYANEYAVNFSKENEVKYIEEEKVVEPTYPLQSISLNKTTSSITVGETDTLKVTYNPTNTTDNKQVNWTSSNAGIAKVDSTGKITAVKAGTATITAKVGSKTASCKVTIKAKETTPTTPTNPTQEDDTLPFKDVPQDSWYYDAVKYAYKNKYIAGYNSTTFAPFDKLSRGQLVTILWRIEGQPDTSKLQNKFTDVDEGVYYTEPIKWANSVGIVKGYGGTTKFGPGDPIIRQDLCIVLNKYAAYKKKSATGTSSLSSFTDYKTVSNYAENAVKWAVQNGIITGNSLPDGTKTIAPMANATRCEVAVMLMRYCNKFN